MTNKLNSTIEIDVVDGRPTINALVFRGWFNPARADLADGAYRIMAPDGVLWHVLSFGGDCGRLKAWHLVHAVYDNETKSIGLERGTWALLTN